MVTRRPQSGRLQANFLFARSLLCPQTTYKFLEIKPYTPQPHLTGFVRWRIQVNLEGRRPKLTKVQSRCVFTVRCDDLLGKSSLFSLSFGEWDQPRNLFLILPILLGMVLHKIALLIPDADGDINCKRSRKKEMANRHVRSRPKEHQKPEHEGVPYVLVESPQFKCNLLRLSASEIMPNLLKPQQLKVIDHEA